MSCVPGERLILTAASEPEHKDLLVRLIANPKNPLSGGTGHTILVCRAMGVAVYEQSLWDKWL